VLPRLVDRVCGVGELHRRRARACEGLSGRVLELGFGSGHNVEHYPAAVTEVSAVEPNDDAWHLARHRVAASRVPVLRSGLDGQRLTEADASVDHVLTTFTLCTIPRLDAALAEAHRVLRPGGEVHFLEHGLAPDPGVRRWQRRLEPVQRRLAGGCHLTRDPVAALEGAGFEVVEVERGYLPGPAVARPGTYLYAGRARRP
jgi:ubiquinone/menaquinone biosynthesis C-methylase UbiE